MAEENTPSLGSSCAVSISGSTPSFAPRSGGKPHPVCAVTDLPLGARKIVEVAGKSIGVFNVHGTLHAVLNICPHAFAPVCAGPISGTTLTSSPGDYKWGREGEILACPWHGWEFDILSGQCLSDPCRLKKFPVEVVDGVVLVTLP